MAKDTRTRKWLGVINNPDKYGYTHETIKERFNQLKSIEYWVISDEIGEEGTYHTHFYIYASNAIRFSTMNAKFPEAHLEMARGTSQENRDYIFKEGKWEKSKKKETNLTETHEEYGQMPVERQGARNDLYDLQDMIISGMTNAEIIKENPNYMLQIEKLDKIRMTLLEEKYKNVWRNLEVVYIWGVTGTGKTKDVMESSKQYSDVYKISDYINPWDLYMCQDIVLFDEFRSSLKMQEMLNLLDGYPLALRARYSNRIACYTKVYITSNIPIWEQYKNYQKDEPLTWQAFLRRINKYKFYDEDGKIYEFNTYKEAEDWYEKSMPFR